MYSCTYRVTQAGTQEKDQLDRVRRRGPGSFPRLRNSTTPRLHDSTFRSVGWLVGRARRAGGLFIPLPCAAGASCRRSISNSVSAECVLVGATFPFAKIFAVRARSEEAKVPYVWMDGRRSGEDEEQEQNGLPAGRVFGVLPRMCNGKSGERGDNADGWHMVAVTDKDKEARNFNHTKPLFERREFDRGDAGWLAAATRMVWPAWVLFVVVAVVCLAYGTMEGSRMGCCGGDGGDDDDDDDDVGGGKADEEKRAGAGRCGLGSQSVEEARESCEIIVTLRKRVPDG
ncbi:hypothetical protein JOL62DRAFT_585607 [Phyllosticta paracitricarpa]|uniref:Uncharacterized protein n=1 Tax=Phyllosticta paracitricarpa TaxID=2016321 RepID=A0ABR1MY81_9PEZI